jgi:hypothetical protein
MIVVLPVPGPPMITMIFSALLKNKRQNYLNLLGFEK